MTQVLILYNSGVVLTHSYPYTFKPVDKRDNEFLLRLSRRAPAIKTALDFIPSAVALWDRDHIPFILNRQARQLIGFSESEFQKDVALWTDRIHRSDRDRFSAAWKRLLRGEKTFSCDYRFSPKNGEEHIWLRDVSVAHPSTFGEVEGVTSAYINISDLMEDWGKNQSEPRGPEVARIIDGVVHDIQNNLQIISMGLELLRLGGGTPLEFQPLFRGIEQVNKSIKELREYFFPPKPQFSRINPGVILEDLVQSMKRELDRHGIRLRTHRRGLLPLVRLDPRQFRKALERVLEFCRMLLPGGGELEVEARFEEMGAKRYVKLQVVSSSASLMEMEEEDVFRPFLRVKGQQVGLTLVMAQQILRRHRGEIFFQKENPKRGLFTILLEAH